MNESGPGKWSVDLPITGLPLRHTEGGAIHTHNKEDQGEREVLQAVYPTRLDHTVPIKTQKIKRDVGLVRD
jgi:hypothetical protein